MKKEAEVRLSKSKILTYENCPFKFMKLFIDKIKITFISPALIRGCQIHNLLDKFYNPKTDDILRLREEIKTHSKYRKYKKSIDNFILFNVEKSENGKIKKPLFKEVKIFDEEYNISGIIDRVDENINGISVIDYKTGKLHSLEKFRFELAIYTYLFEKKFKKIVSHWGVYFVDHNKLRVEKIDRKLIKDSLDKVEDVRKKIARKEFPKKKNQFCWNCDVRKNGFCDMQVSTWRS